MYCSKCGHKTGHGDKFCSACGAIQNFQDESFQADNSVKNFNISYKTKRWYTKWVASLITLGLIVLLAFNSRRISELVTTFFSSDSQTYGSGVPEVADKRYKEATKKMNEKYGDRGLMLYPEDDIYPDAITIQDDITSEIKSIIKLSGFNIELNERNKEILRDYNKAKFLSIVTDFESEQKVADNYYKSISENDFPLFLMTHNVNDFENAWSIIKVNPIDFLVEVKKEFNKLQADAKDKGNLRVELDDKQDNKRLLVKVTQKGNKDYLDINYKIHSVNNSEWFDEPQWYINWYSPDTKKILYHVVISAEEVFDSDTKNSKEIETTNSQITKAQAIQILMDIKKKENMVVNKPSEKDIIMEQKNNKNYYRIDLTFTYKLDHSRSRTSSEGTYYIDAETGKLYHDIGNGLEKYQEDCTYYTDNKFKYTISFPNSLGTLKKDPSNNSISIEVKAHNITLDMDAISLDDIASDITRDEYIEMRTSAGGYNKVEKKVDVKGAEEAYLIREGDATFSGKTVIAFRGRNLYRLSYGITHEENEDTTNITKVYDQYIIKMLQFIVID
jgi:hypothetical protein